MRIKVGDTVAVPVTVGDSVAIGVLRKDVVFARLFEVIVDAVVVAIRVAKVAVRGKSVGSIGKGMEWVARVFADHHGRVHAHEADPVHLVEVSDHVTGTVIHGGNYQFTFDLDVIVKLMFEVREALLLVAFGLDVLEVGDDLAAILSVTTILSFSPFVSREARNLTGHKAVVEIARGRVIGDGQSAEIILGFKRCGRASGIA